MFPRYWRERALEESKRPFDLVILGGGITGCGIFMDASQRGLRALLIEKNDIASGTSSRSSKMIHGGLRYLKQMQFRVTRLACRERDRYLALNPDLVVPIPFIFPTHSGDELAGWEVDLGLWMYDRLTRASDRHRHLSEAELGELAPGLDLRNLDRAMAYHDAMTDDARLTLAVAATGVAYGGQLLTRVEALAPRHDANGRLTGIVARDLENGTDLAIDATLVINACGVWVDRVRALFGHDAQRLRPSRGTHLIFDRRRLPVRAALTLPSPDDARPVFVVPHPEGVLVGTTDLFHDGSLDDPRPTTAEVEYLLRTIVHHFPLSKLSGNDVVGAFAGLRPILDSHGDDPSEASREEAVWMEDGLMTVAGGKLTTWRSTAEEAVDEALEALPEERAAQAAPCYTAGTPLVGLAPRDLGHELSAARPMLSPDIARAWEWRLRGGAWTALEMLHDPAEARPMSEGSDLTAGEFRYQLRYGAVLRLEDLLLRRIRVGMWNPALAREIAPSLRHLAQEELGWSTARWDQELDSFFAAAAAWSPPSA